MKFSLIVAVVVLALAQGSFADSATDLETITQYFEEMKTKISQEISDLIANQDLTNKAQNFQTQLEPVVAQLQEKLRTVATNVEEQVKPMATGMQAQIQPMVEKLQTQVQDLLRTLTDQARAIGN